MDEVNLNINIKFHQLLLDIENIFWFYLLSNNVLADPEVQNILKMKQAPYLISMLNRYNDWVSLKTEIDYNNKTFKSTMSAMNSSVLIGKTMAIVMYELLKSSKYYSTIKQSEEFIFLRQIRNAAAHNNKFNFMDKKGKWILEEQEVIKFGESYAISRNLQNKEVFNNFIAFSGIFMLAKHFSDKLVLIDSGQNHN